ncbi:MAG: AAA family ATPase [Microthrixaceae bacterium]
MDLAIDTAARLRSAVNGVVRGKSASVDLALATCLSGGHLLVEDLPGTGKTTLARTLAAAVGGTFGRVQCTPDLLPTDVTGTSVFRADTADWEFHPGPVFANVVIIDEVNRASPRTQSALLEPMEEHQVTVDGTTRPLPDPFMCIATQNPYGQAGTFPLPESQLDRFATSLSMGLPGREAERELLMGQGGTAALSGLPAVTTPAELAASVRATRSVYCAAALGEYLLDLVDATRDDQQLSRGASPRAALGILALARGTAVVRGRDHVTPDDIQVVFTASLAHRVAVGDRVDTPGARAVLATVLERVPVPRP